MTFKIHSKLNRLTELTSALQQLGEEITDLDYRVKGDEKKLDLLHVHYMQTEMEYGELIGEKIDHFLKIESLLIKHGMQKSDGEKKPVDENDFYLVKRSDGMYWGGRGWEKDRTRALGFSNADKAWSFINKDCFDQHALYGKPFRYKPVLNFADFDSTPNSEF